VAGKASTGTEHALGLDDGQAFESRLLFRDATERPLAANLVVGA
jgi:hypothetical protein